MKQLGDLDPMPFGKHKGVPMQDVPASYLHWLWSNADAPLRDQVKTSPVAEYIDRNFNALKKEHDDGIWEESEK